ncbi:transcription termination factor Rho [Candidatus Poriferisocius sp.]|uniref:transcription termination factor Rho n=1 Tax=Candidatus Poriferisocius sp. TaxID=3101276 RepID=UPI003B02DF73
MSVETTELSQSKLQRKDRAQLQIIARAMGGRPDAKARKADIVDLILELAGIGADGDGQAAPDPNGNGAAPAQAASAEDGGGAEPSDETEGKADLVEARRAEEADSSSSDEGQARQEESAEDTAPEKKADRGHTDEDRGDRQGRGERQDRERQSRDGQGRGERQDRERQSRDGQGRGERQDRDGQGRGERQDRERQSRDGQGRGERQDRERQSRDGQGRGERQDRPRHQEDQPEAGNRRRRRRGRNERERSDEPWEGDPIAISGYLDLRDDGYGFLRIKGFQPSKEDAYVSVKQVRQFGLRKGDYVTGGCRPATRNEKNPAILHIDSVNGQPPESVKQRPEFEDLTPLFPDENLRLERVDDPANMTCRIIDLLSPIGKGQRGLIVSPPKAGKTTILKEIVRSIELNNPEVHLLVLLVDERPEEVTDMRRWLLRGEVAASTFDRPADEHTHVAEMTIERAKRMVERGEDVVIMLDGITRLSRAYNLAAPATGRIMSGGIDTGALYPPKKFFGAARNVEEGGSLTILATALVETGSRMDEVIFEEFKGTGNMELRLDRHIAERRIYPAINVDASSTRHEELLFERRQLQQVWKLRRVLNGLSSDGNGGGAAGLELLMDRLRTFPNNAAFLEEVAKGPAGV